MEKVAMFWKLIDFQRLPDRQNLPTGVPPCWTMNRMPWHCFSSKQGGKFTSLYQVPVPRWKWINFFLLKKVRVDLQTTWSGAKLSGPGSEDRPWGDPGWQCWWWWRGWRWCCQCDNADVAVDGWLVCHQPHEHPTTWLVCHQWGRVMISGAGTSTSSQERNVHKNELNPWNVDKHDDRVGWYAETTCYENFHFF